MPNNVINELIFRKSHFVKQRIIQAALCGEGDDVDFGVLVPIAPNVWRGNIGEKHKRRSSGQR